MSKELHLKYCMGPRFTFDWYLKLQVLSLILWEWCKSGQNLAQLFPTFKETKTVKHCINQTRDQTAVDIFSFFLVFSSSGEVLSLLVLDFYTAGHLHNPHFLSDPLQVVNPLFDTRRQSASVLWNHSLHLCV